MRTTILAVTGFLLLQCAIFSAQFTTTIEGVVREAATDRPMAGVKIGLLSGGVQTRTPQTSATTDSQGRFSIEAKEFGRFRIVPSLDGFLFLRPGQTRAPAEPGVWIQVSPGQSVSNIELRMARPAVISGRVLDFDGKPVVGTAGSVALQRYRYDATGTRYLSWVPGIAYPGAAGSFVRMNDRGEYRFYDLPPGEYYLAISGGGAAIGTARTYYYPGSLDETKAIPIRVGGGEEIQINTITLPPRQKGVQVRLHLKGPANGLSEMRRVQIGDGALYLPIGQPDAPIEAAVGPGHYEVVVTTGGGFGRDLYYGRVSLDIGSSDIDQDVSVIPGARVTGTLQLEQGGQRSPAWDVRCRIRSAYGLGECLKSQVVPGRHELELEEIPPDAYVMSAQASGRSVLTEGLDINGDTELEIILASPGGIIQGTVRNADGRILPSAVVAVVPDAPYRSFGPHYRAVITDPNGRFEIHGIAPGAYHLFAWTELEGAAYRNAEFMKEFEDRGRAVVIEKSDKVSMDLTAF